jgi:hypothetical protein
MAHLLRVATEVVGCKALRRSCVDIFNTFLGFAACFSVFFDCNITVLTHEREAYLAPIEHDSTCGIGVSTWGDRDGVFSKARPMFDAREGKRTQLLLVVVVVVVVVCCCFPQLVG